MLYTTIISASTAFIFISFGSIDGAYVVADVVPQQNVICPNLSYDDTCVVNCTLPDDGKNKPAIPEVNCGDAGYCIINCYHSCLANTNIYTTNSHHLQFNSLGTKCVENAHLYLPSTGNATIIGNTNGITEGVLQLFTIYSGSNTNKIHIECNDPSNDDSVAKDDCAGLQIYAETANSLEITLSGAEFESSKGAKKGDVDTPAIVFCPIDSLLSPSCIINANNAFSTQNLEIHAPKGMPQDVMFYSDGAIQGNYQGTTIICSDGTSVIQDDTFVGTSCYIPLPQITTTKASTTKVSTSKASTAKTSTTKTSTQVTTKHVQTNSVTLVNSPILSSEHHNDHILATSEGNDNVMGTVFDILGKPINLITMAVLLFMGICATCAVCCYCAWRKKGVVEGIKEGKIVSKPQSGTVNTISPPPPPPDSQPRYSPKPHPRYSPEPQPRDSPSPQPRYSPAPRLQYSKAQLQYSAKPKKESKAMERVKTESDDEESIPMKPEVMERVKSESDNEESIPKKVPNLLLQNTGISRMDDEVLYEEDEEDGVHNNNDQDSSIEFRRAKSSTRDHSGSDSDLYLPPMPVVSDDMTDTHGKIESKRASVVILPEVHEYSSSSSNGSIDNSDSNQDIIIIKL